MLACLPDALPVAREPVGEGGLRMVIFENAGPFSVARRVLGELKVRPYGMIAYGGGRGVLAALGHIRTLDCRVESTHYSAISTTPGSTSRGVPDFAPRNSGSPSWYRPASFIGRCCLRRRRLAIRKVGQPRSASRTTSDARSSTCCPRSCVVRSKASCKRAAASPRRCSAPMSFAVSGRSDLWDAGRCTVGWFPRGRVEARSGGRARHPDMGITDHHARLAIRVRHRGGRCGDGSVTTRLTPVRSGSAPANGAVPV